MGKRCACGALAREGTVICEKCIARAHWRRRVTQGRRRGSGARHRREQDREVDGEQIEDPAIGPHVREMLDRERAIRQRERGAIGFVGAPAAPYGACMARDTLTAPRRMIEQLRRLGVAVPATADELTTDEFFAFWREVAAADERPDLGLQVGTATSGQSVSSQAALQAATLGDALRTYGEYLGDSLTVEVPTGSGRHLTLCEAADVLDSRLVDLFRRGADGRRYGRPLVN